MGCRFCASTIGGLVRNLTPSEMLTRFRLEQYANALSPISPVFGPMSTVSMCSIVATFRKESIAELLETRSFLDLIGRNEYQGIRWFRGEAFQECMYLSFLSKAIHSKEALTDKQEAQMRKEIDSWLKKGSAAQYRLDNLLSL